jgi:thiol-disulfide isomerase/thioredoxin
MSRRLVLSLLALLLAVTTAVATTADPRGWSQGQMAVGAPRVLAGPDTSKLPALEFDKDFAKKLGDGRTFIYYFSPSCPHCQAVGEELGDLGRALKGKATVIGVATGSSLKGDVATFKETYGIDDEVVVDLGRTISSALGVRSTPSAVLVEPGEKKGTHTIVDLWYPYQPGFDTYVKMRVLDDPWKAFDGTYLTNGSCGACHQQELEGWALSHHSVAWRTLVKKGEHENAECTGCHVTGNGEKTGWAGPSTPDLVNVGCESCHGPSGPHDGEVTEPTSTCAACHDEKHSIAFTVEKGMPHIDHYAGVAMTDEQFRERRLALMDGEAPKPLLAFDAEANQGAEACRSCHEAEYADWKKTPHGTAMATLQTPGEKVPEGAAEDVACVKCHATGAAGGPPGSTLADFKTDESVGCEACHGPGGAHIEAGGGTDNIERLGDDCPVCVIEAVCTSCHTKKWDPDWDLERDLPKVGHE